MNPFNLEMSHFGPKSSVWIYVGDKRLTDDQAAELIDKTTAYCESWTNHGKSIRAESIMLENQVLIFIIDSEKGKYGGCSIDSSVRFIKEQGEAYKIDFFNRLLCGYIVEDTFSVVPVTSIIELSNDHLINRDTLVLNTMISTREELEDKLFLPLHQSWYSRYLK